MTDWDDMAYDDEARRSKELLAQSKLEGVVQQLSRTNDGIFFLRWIIQETGVLQQGYPADDRLSVYQSGRRSVGMQIFSICAAVKCVDKICAREPEE
jgi:hypothetical protein